MIDAVTAMPHNAIAMSQLSHLATVFCVIGFDPAHHCGW
jgi:hypothetical protein